MNRRNTIKSMGAITAHALFPSILTGFLVSCQQNSKSQLIEKESYRPIFFSDRELSLVKEMIDLMLPQTFTMSASEVGTHHFMDEVFGKCLDEKQQNLIKNGLSVFNQDFENSKNKYELLVDIDKKAFSGEGQYSWFKSIKQFAMIGYFTSREGETRSSNYIPVPGDYIGDITMNNSTLNYGLTNLHYYL